MHRHPAHTTRHATPRSTMAVARLALASLLAGALLAGCGGGSGGSEAQTAATGGSTTAGLAGCDTTRFVAGAVAQPTATQMTAYAGTYNGDEGRYGPNPGDPFVKSASATMVLSAGGALTYKGTAYPVTSICIDKAAGPVGLVLYVHTDKGHFDVSDKVDPVIGSAWGVSPVDGATVWTNGRKP